MANEKSTIYRNAMESLVAEELERQFQLVPPKLGRYLSREEVTAFALNRLPPLYATS
ncbi:MAG: late competence development ComFB family protein [Cyanobacteria bacterium]|nr:late competence development ComFB family protein [Cyanobacteriota bacterium]MDW8201024.1 late competence development ComFB family protein [Cyanobacteriota bacterium SKYGB_h_bin112]